MPCNSYESDWARGSNDGEVRRLKAVADRLARIACKAMTELTEQGRADFLLLRDEEVSTWWTKHQEDDRKEREREAARKRKEEIKNAALAKLSDEEKSALGIRTKV
jgi:hypothetical protein